VLRSSHSHSKANRDAQSLASRADDISTTKRFDKSNKHTSCSETRHAFCKEHIAHIFLGNTTCNTRREHATQRCLEYSIHAPAHHDIHLSLGSRHPPQEHEQPGSAVLESAISLTRHNFPVSLAGPGPRRVCYCRTEWLGSSRNLLRGPPSNRFEVVRELRMGGMCGTVWCGVLYL
jgi:hypothetical protein